MNKDCILIGVDFIIPKGSVLKQYEYLYSQYEVKVSEPRMIYDYFKQTPEIQLHYAYSSVKCICANDHKKIFYKLKDFHKEEWVSFLKNHKQCWCGLTYQSTLRHKIVDPRFYIMYKEHDVTDTDYKHEMDLKTKKNN